MTEPVKYDDCGSITPEWARWAAVGALTEAALDDLPAEERDPLPRRSPRETERRWHQELRNCPECGDYHCRMVETESGILAGCKKCGAVRPLQCPRCDCTEFVVDDDWEWANGTRGRRAACLECGYTGGGQWNIGKRNREGHLSWLVRSGAGSCSGCGAELAHLEGHAHHRVPIAQGGPDILDNLERLCVPCHHSRHRAGK